MKYLLISILSLFMLQVRGKEQVSDYLIMGKDTLPILNYPLEQYFDKIGNRDILAHNNPCWYTDCYRGYQAYWIIRNDSLCLLKIAVLEESCYGYKDAELKSVFGTNLVFADWYSGNINIPRGEPYPNIIKGYPTVYESEEIITFKKGRKIDQFMQSNKVAQESMIVDVQFSEKILKITDTLLYYLNNFIDWERLNDSKYFWCDDGYILSYNSIGTLTDVKLNAHFSSRKFKDRIFNNRMNNRCSHRVKKALKDLSLNYLIPHKSFMVEIVLSYGESLEIEQCTIHHKSMTDKDFKKLVLRK